MVSALRMKTFSALSFFILLFALILPSCSSPQYWAKPGAKPGDFDRDLVDCKRTLAGSQGGGFSAAALNPAYGIPQSAVDQCMGQKGWYLADKPPDEEAIEPPN